MENFKPVRVWLGEILLGEVRLETLQGRPIFKVGRVATSGIADIITTNNYLELSDAIQAIKHQIPTECREFCQSKNY